VIAYAHHIIAKQLFLILYIFEEGLKNVSGVKDPHWLGGLIDNRNVFQAMLFDG
jgi:hypothetical protein